MKKLTNSTDELVFVQREDVFTDSWIISQGTGVRHDKIKNTINKYRAQIEKFGMIKTEKEEILRKKRITPYGVTNKIDNRLNIYLLNEPQATFLITLLKNTDTVIKFKLELVKEFYRMRKIIVEKKSVEWQQTRQLGKLARREETDAIKKFIEYAKAQGSKNADRYYVHFSKLANKLAGIHGNMRDLISGKQLMYLSIAESSIVKTVTEGMQQNLDRHSIYKLCKSRLDILTDIAIIPESNCKMQIASEGG